MRRSRIYQPQQLGGQTHLALDREGSHYVGRVLRLKPGDSITLFNNQDGEFVATIRKLDRQQVLVELGEPVANTANPQLTVHLGLGLSRGERFDYAIQKSTELGATAITPLVTEHCEVRLNRERSEKKLAHWQKVAISASEQCGRSKVPLINAPEQFGNWLDQNPGGLLLDATGQSGLSSEVAMDTVNLLIGPEGGFSSEEVELARRHDYQVIRLGPRILRTETAPVVALALLQYLYGDLQR